jgi:hypothetical protein
MASPARILPYQAVHTLRTTVVFTDDGVAVAVGTVPNNAVLTPATSGIYVGTAFDGSTGDTVDIGFAAHTNSSGVAVVADPDAFATALDASSVGFVGLDVAAAVVVTNADGAGIPVTATYTDATGDAAAGTLEVVIHYTIDG